MSLAGVSVELTEEAVTVGRVRDLQPWLGQHPEPALLEPDGRSENVPFAMVVNHGDFVRGQQMAISKDRFLSILSIDAYNHGHGADIALCEATNG